MEKDSVAGVSEVETGGPWSQGGDRATVQGLEGCGVRAIGAWEGFEQGLLDLIFSLTCGF